MYQNYQSSLGIFGLSSFWCKEQNQQFFMKMAGQKLRTIDWELDRTSQVSIQGEIKYSVIEVYVKESHFFRTTDLSEF